MVTRPQFIGFGRPRIALRGTGWGSPPQFTPGSTHTAMARLLNPTDRLWGYKGEVYLDGRIASSGIVEFTIEAGAERTIDFPVIMPEETMDYEAYLDVSVGEELVLHWPFPEPVTIAGPPGPAYYLVPWRPSVYSSPEGAWAYISVTAVVMANPVTGQLAPMSTVVKPAPALEIREVLSPFCPPTDSALCETVPPLYEVALQRIAGLEHLLEYPDAPIKCPQCGAEFWKREELERHKAEVHPPPPLPPLEDRVAAILQGEYHWQLCGVEPNWMCGGDWLQGALQNRVDTYRMNAAKAGIDPDLAEAYLAVAGEFERIKVECKALWDTYAASGVMGGYNSVYAMYLGTKTQPWKKYQLIAIINGLKESGIWEEVLQLLEADYPGIGAEIEQMIA